MLVLAGAASPGAFLDGDSSVAESSSAHLATFGTPGLALLPGGPRSSGGPKRPAAAALTDPPPPKTPRGDKGAGKKQDLSSMHNFRYLKNRQGNPICEAYQAGNCQGTGITCNADPNRRHLCAKCLGMHPADNPPCPGNKTRPTGGGGKGGGRRGGKKGL